MITTSPCCCSWDTTTAVLEDSLIVDVIGFVGPSILDTLPAACRLLDTALYLAVVLVENLCNRYTTYR